MTLLKSQQGNFITHPSYEKRCQPHEEWLEDYSKKLKLIPYEYFNKTIILGSLTDSYNHLIVKNALSSFVFSKITDAIEKSKYILSLKDNWDEEGSKGYNQKTWQRAVNFVSNYAEWVFEISSRIIDPPEIYHGPESSIDLLWKNERYRLLINIPDDESKPATFYGDDYKSEKIEGTFDPLKFNQGILLSLIEL